jgi:HAD superfamily hydrolase (TIGR01509 family)
VAEGVVAKDLHARDQILQSYGVDLFSSRAPFRLIIDISSFIAAPTEAAAHVSISRAHEILSSAVGYYLCTSAVYRREFRRHVVLNKDIIAQSIMEISTWAMRARRLGRHERWLRSYLTQGTVPDTFLPIDSYTDEGCMNLQSAFSLTGLVFDWDGTLVDSQTAYVEAFRSTLATSGYQMSVADADYVVGRAFPDCLAYFSNFANFRSPSSFEQEWRADFNTRLEGGIPVFPDAVECLEYANALNLPLAVATQTPRRQFEIALDAVGLRHLVPVSVCRDEVGRPKPAPDLYITACSRIGQPPSQCLAIEDSPTGAASARDAGLVVLAVARDPAKREALKKLSHTVVDTLRPLLVAQYMRADAQHVWTLLAIRCDRFATRFS